jgi:hypothetical protein
MPRLVLPLALAATLLAGCDMLGIQSPEQQAAAREAEGKAIGAACRQAGRAIEDCYTLNRRIGKAAIFAGWLEMNDYMREHKLETVTPVIVASQGEKATEPKSKRSTRGAEAKDSEQDTNAHEAESEPRKADKRVSEPRRQDSAPS